jgi:hypothetical protein
MSFETDGSLKQSIRDNVLSDVQKTEVSDHSNEWVKSPVKLMAAVPL